MKEGIMAVAVGIGIGLVSNLMFTDDNQVTKQSKDGVEASTVKVKADDNRKGFHCLSGWDGSHRATVNYVKKNLRDPESYQHIETRITPVDKDGNHTLVMQYRAKNGFGGYVPGSVLVTVKNSDCSGTVVGNL
jgi:uncharacterized protein (DUF736 family)